MPVLSSRHKIRSNAVKSGFSLLDMSTSFARLPLTDALLDWGFCHQTFLWLLLAVFLKKLDLFIFAKITLLPTGWRNQRELVDSLTGQLHCSCSLGVWACWQDTGPGHYFLARFDAKTAQCQRYKIFFKKREKNIYFFFIII